MLLQSSHRHQDRYGSPLETRTHFFPFSGKEDGPLNAPDKPGTFSLGRSRTDPPPLSPPDFGLRNCPPGQNRLADFIRSEFGFRVAPKHHSTPLGALVQTRFQRGVALKFAPFSRVKVAPQKDTGPTAPPPVSFR